MSALCARRAIRDYARALTHAHGPPPRRSHPFNPPSSVPPTVIYNDQLAWPALRSRLAAREWDNVVISPGPGTPAAPADVGVCLDLLRWAAGVGEDEDGGGGGSGGAGGLSPPIPVLGVCLGMQALALALGGRVVRADAPVHGRLSAVRHDGDCPLFASIPSAGAGAVGGGGGLEVVRYHSLMVDAAGLPACLLPTAWTVGATHAVSKEGEAAGGGGGCASPARPSTAGRPQPDEEPPLDGGRPVLMAVRHARLPLFGVQFHPESVATTHGARLCANFRDVTLAGLAWAPGPAVPAVAAAADAAVVALLEEGGGGVVASSPASPPAPPPVPDAHATPTTTLLTARLPGAAATLAHHAPGGAGEALFFSLFAPGHASADTFWLDSSSAPDRGRFSFMGGPGGRRWRRLGYRLGGDGGSDGGGVLTTSSAAHPRGSTAARAALWSTLAAGLADAALDPAGLAAAAALPFAFVGGWVGYLGYELRAECGAAAYRAGGGGDGGAAARVPASSLPDAAFFFVDRLLAVDHTAGDVFVVALADVGEDAAGARAWVDSTAAAVARLAAADAPEAAAASAAPPTPRLQSGTPPPFTVRRGRATYLADVDACRAALTAGDSYELCLTTALTRSPAGLPDPAALYRTLRRVNPAPYAAFLDFQALEQGDDGGPRGLALCCSSPERFLRGGADGSLEARPIKGTARRVPGDPAADAAAAAALAASEKDRAENLMIVDLLRNDLGRVCTTGSVRVPGLMEVESFATVHQLVSTVVGRRAPGVSALAAVRAAFPGGSMTGAPKQRSMEILDGLEQCARGPYSGGVGWFSVLPGTPFDVNIVIRTAILDRGADALTIGAGGAVVIQSTPEGEYEEMRLKAAALLRAVGEVDAAGGAKGGGAGPAAVVDE